MIEPANTPPDAPRTLGLIGKAYGLDRQPDTLRFARDTDSTRRDPLAWWEPNIPKDKPRPFRWGPPMRDAPSGFSAQLQLALLTPPRRGWITVDRVCWIVACFGLAWLAWAAFQTPAP